jgi:cytoskeleton protein RodZ
LASGGNAEVTLPSPSFENPVQYGPHCDEKHDWKGTIAVPGTVRRHKVIWQRGGTARRRDDHEEKPSSSAEGIGWLLRAAREERGLDLLTVHDRLNRPITQLEALENGDLASLPDQALALSTLRRYASLLDLDGDALALQMIDAWSVAGVASPSPSPAERDPVGVGAVTGVVTAVATAPEHLRAFTQTGEVPNVGRGSSTGRYGNSDYDAGPPTGTFPVLPREEIRHSKRAIAKARRRMRAPTSLKVVTWIAGFLLLVVVAGFAIQRWSPPWLVSVHVLRVAAPGSSSSSTGEGGGSGPKQSSVVTETQSTPQSASYTVAASDFVVRVGTTGRCWVQVTSSNSSTPLASSVEEPGQLLSFPANGTMTVQLGASAAAVAIYVNKNPEFLQSPSATPYTYTFASSGGSS